MKYQPISNFHFSDGLPDLSEQIKAEMERRGMKPNPMPVIKTLDFGIKLPSHKPMRERELSPTELLGLFDKRESLCMVYIPHFITQCIMYYIDALCNYTVENRLSEYKKLKRTLSEVKREYYSALRMEMPPKVFEKFLSQRDDYIAACGANLQIIFFTFSNELSHKHKHVENGIVICYAFMIASLAQYIEDYDSAVNRKIAEKLNMPTRNYGDARVKYVKNLCKGIVGKYDMPQTQQTTLAMQVIANKAKEMINKMID